ncbi:hypothetical protein [Escherichia coli]
MNHVHSDMGLHETEKTIFRTHPKN